jgi:hypothetical protein
MAAGLGPGSEAGGPEDGVKMADHGTILVKLEDIIRSIGLGDPAEAITIVDSVLRDDIDPLFAQPNAGRDLFQRALKLQEELIAGGERHAEHSGDFPASFGPLSAATEPGRA